MMPYETSASKLDSFNAEALRNEEIQDGAKRAELEEESLTSTLRGRASEIWEAASSEIETYNQLETKLEATLTELRHAEAVAVEELSFFRRMLLIYKPDTKLGWVWQYLFYIFLLMTLAFVVPALFPPITGADIVQLLGGFVFIFAPMLLFQRLARRQVSRTKASTTRGSSTNFGIIVSIAVVASIIAALLLANQSAVAAAILIVFAVLGALLLLENLILNSLSRRLPERDNNGTK